MAGSNRAANYSAARAGDCCGSRLGSAGTMRRSIALRVGFDEEPAGIQLAPDEVVAARPQLWIERITREQLTLQDAVKHVFEECRMVLPGIQALFGFQMIAAIIWHERAVALAAAVGTALLCALVWEGYPSLYRLRRRSRS
jgi:hypothetical protein